MITRQDYLTGKATHREYYGDIVNHCGIILSADDPMVKEALESSDQNYNDIELYRWDGYAAIFRDHMAPSMRERGDSWSQAGGVCVMKEAVRQTIERNRSAKEEDDFTERELENNRRYRQHNNLGEYAEEE